jgi:hypothetical protein
MKRCTSPAIDRFQFHFGGSAQTTNRAGDAARSETDGLILWIDFLVKNPRNPDVKLQGPKSTAFFPIAIPGGESRGPSGG